MLSQEELKRLKEMDVDKIVWAIGSACRNSVDQDRAVIATAYVLMRSLEDYQISIDTMEYYLQTARESNERMLFIQRAIGPCWDSIRGLKYRFSSDEFKAALLFYNGSANRGWDCTTPTCVSRLAARLIDAKPGMTILDLGTGTGGFIRDSILEGSEASYVGVEINVEAAVIAGMRADLLGENVQIRLGNLFDDPSLERRFDAVFANYPFGLRPKNLGSFGEEYVRRLSNYNPAFSKLSSTDWIFNRKAYDCVNGPGRVICIMANGSTWNTIDKNARRDFLEGGLVEAVISLPPRIYDSTSIGTTMIVFSHGNTSTMMVNAEDLYEKGRRINTITDAHIEKILTACRQETEISRRVSMTKIQEMQFILSPAAYLETQVEEVKNGVELGSLGSITRGAQLQASVLDEMASDKVTNTQYLMLANIQNGIIEEDLPYLRELDDRLAKYCLKNNNLILSKNGAPFKIAVAEVKEGQHILANGNLYVMTVDEAKADPYYLKAYLESEEGVAALKRITVGSTIPNIGVEQLKKLLIPLPPLEEQRKIADEYRACIADLKLLQRKTAKVLDRMNHIYKTSKED